MASVSNRISKAKKKTSLLGAFNLEGDASVNESAVVSEPVPDEERTKAATQVQATESVESSTQVNENVNTDAIVEHVSTNDSVDNINAATESSVTTEKKAPNMTQEEINIHQQVQGTMELFAQEMDKREMSASIDDAVAHAFDKKDDVYIDAIKGSTKTDESTDEEAITTEEAQVSEYNFSSLVESIKANENADAQEAQQGDTAKTLANDLNNLLLEAHNLTEEELKALPKGMSDALLRYTANADLFISKCIPRGVQACKNCGYCKICPKANTVYEKKRTSLYIPEDVFLAMVLKLTKDPALQRFSQTTFINTLLERAVSDYIEEARALIDKKREKAANTTLYSARKLINATGLDLKDLADKG